MKSAIRLVLIVIAAALAGALITYAIIRPAQSNEEDAPKASSRVSIENGEPTITLDAATQQKIGLATTAVQPVRQAEQLQLFGVVVDVQELTALENQAATARAQEEQAKARAAADRTELERLRALNADNKNVSDRAVQEAAATLTADESAAASAEASLRAAMNTVTQRFGPVIANAVASRSPLYQDLVSLREMLVQVTLPPATSAPKTLNITAPDGSGVPGRLLAQAPRVDPRLQGASWFYLAPGGVLPAGANIVARYGAPISAAGVLIPTAAVVSFEGKSWVYVRRDPTRFSRREISMATPAAGGFFVTSIPAGTELVTTGAQQLLSEEMRSQLHEE